MTDTKTIHVLEFGEGKFVVNHGYYGERAALFIEPAPLPGTSNADATASGLPRNLIADGGTVITFENIASVEALGRELQQAMMRIGSRRGSGHHDDDGSVFTRKYSE